MTQVKLRQAAAGPIGKYVYHPSFQGPGAEHTYADVPEEPLAAPTHMADDVTRDHARRMHYAAYRAERAESFRSATEWRRRYYTLRDRIILGNRKLIYRAVSRRLQAGSGMDDLVGECQIVMIRAVAAYNPWIGIRFSTYACTCLFRALHRLAGQRARGERRGAVELELVLEPAAPPAEMDEPSAEWPAVARYLRDDESLLTVREKRILEHRFGLAGGRGTATLDELAVDLGLSKERVRQLQAGALGKLRNILRTHIPTS